MNVFWKEEYLILSKKVAAWCSHFFKKEEQSVYDPYQTERDLPAHFSRPTKPS